MKIRLLMAGLLGLVSATTFAQKGELNNAQTEYNIYQVSSGAKIPSIISKANESLGNAKTSIDKAAVNQKTAALPQTYARKGAIYSALAYRDTIPSTSAVSFATADEALKKAKELDTKGEYKGLIDAGTTNLANYKLQQGVKEYQSKQYDKAYSSFDYWRQVVPEDTNAIYYTALAATNAAKDDPKFYPLAISNYNKLVATKYSGGANAYLNLSYLYLVSKDTANSLKAASEGVGKFPANSDLRKREIEISLQTGKENLVLEKIQAAINNDPNNKTLYYYEGLTYTRIADAADAKVGPAKDDASKKAFRQTALDNYTKAIDPYKKAISIDPDYFDANFNLGYTLMKPAIDIYNDARLMPANKEKEYEAMRIKADAQFELAKPYLQRAVDLNPKSSDALSDLRNYYKGKYDPAHAADNTAKAAELKKQIDAL